MDRRPLAIALILGVAVAAIAVAPVAAAGPAPDRATERFEIRFIQRTIEHHLMGVEMAELCVDRATAPPPDGDATLREVCASIAATQAAEAGELQELLMAWYGVDFEPMMAGGMTSLERLSGEAFDAAVSEMFIKHHLRQIRSSAQCVVRAYHEELVQRCLEMIDVQSEEVVVFRDILRQHGEQFRGS